MQHDIVWCDREANFERLAPMVAAAAGAGARMVVLAEMMDIEAGHISLASPLGRALKGRRVGDELELRLPRGTRALKVLEIV